MDLTKYNINADNKILQVALTHTSYANEHRCESYERLEFLGDAVLELVTSEYFYKNTKLSEGEMTKKRARFVCEKALFEYAKKINLEKHIKLGHGLENTINETIIADVFEAVIAAIYLNSGLAKAREFILDSMLPFINQDAMFLSDYKSYLQELVQTTQKSVVYRLINEMGPAHDRVFEVQVLVEDMVYGTGIGKSKKEAEQNAAKDAILKSAGGIFK